MVLGEDYHFLGSGERKGPRQRQQLCKGTEVSRGFSLPTKGRVRRLEKGREARCSLYRAHVYTELDKEAWTLWAMGS